MVLVVVETLRAVALVGRQRVLAVALLADFVGEQRALVNICAQGTRNLFFRKREALFNLWLINSDKFNQFAMLTQNLCAWLFPMNII